MSKIKIVHILHSIGGVDTSLRVILENIDSSTIENIIVHGKKDNQDFFDKSNKRLKDYKLPIERNISPFKDISSIISAWKIIKREKPDIIHGHSAKGGIVANVVGRFFRNTIVLHTPQAYSFLSAENKYIRKIYIVIERLVRSKKSVLLASSQSELDRGVKEIHYPKEQTVLFNNCIAPIKLNPEFSDLTNYRLPKDFICTVGRPSYQKNIEMMIEVIRKVKEVIPNIYLVVMGVGVVSPNTENVKALITKYNLESNVKLIDWTERERIFHIISKSKFYLSTARYEGLPYAILESLSLSKAIIATDCDGNRDVVVDNYNGFLIEENNVDLFANKTIQLYNSDQLRHNFEKNSIKLSLEQFNLENNIKQLEQIYKEFS